MGRIAAGFKAQTMVAGTKMFSLNGNLWGGTWVGGGKAPFAGCRQHTDSFKISNSRLVDTLSDGTVSSNKLYNINPLAGEALFDVKPYLYAVNPSGSTAYEFGNGHCAVYKKKGGGWW